MGLDVYKATLVHIIHDLESIYDIGSMNKGDIPINSVMNKIKNDFKTLNENEILERNMRAGRVIASLSYCYFRMDFFKIKRLNYKAYPCLDIIIDTLKKYIEFSDISENNKYEINKVIALLNELDKSQPKLVTTMSYRFLRIFILLVLNNSLANASVVAKFVLQQIILNYR